LINKGFQWGDLRQKRQCFCYEKASLLESKSNVIARQKQSFCIDFCPFPLSYGIDIALHIF
jgi:hypothetical protein